MAYDAVAGVIGWSGGAVLDGATRTVPPPASGTGVPMVLVGAAVSLVCFSTAGLYRSPVNGIRAGALGPLVQSMGSAAAFVLVWQGVVGDAAPRLVLAAVTVALAATVVARCAFDVWLVDRREHGDFRTPVVIAGTADETTALAAFLRRNPEAGYRATAIVGEPPTSPVGDPADLPWMGGLDRAREAVHRTGASGVLVGVSGLRSDSVNRLVHGLSSVGISVHLSAGLSGVSRRRLQTFALAHEPVVEVSPPPRASRLQEAAKRALDVALASLLLIVSAPLIAVSAVMIKAQDRGPVFFRQVRIGRDGRPFTLVKLRTMAVDAEARLAEVHQRNERHGPLFKVSDDPRVTRVGGFLRATGIDELPQLCNVLSGRMSIVGPRPALPAETAQFDDELQRRHLVRPGVTGLWQVEANHKASFDEYRRLDLFYVDNWSLTMDLTVIVDTFQAIVRRVIRTLRRPAPTAPAPAGLSPLPDAAEVAP